LQRLAPGEGLGALVRIGWQGGQALGYGRLGHAGAVGPCREGLGIGGQRVSHGHVAFYQGALQGVQLGQFFVGTSQPAAQLGVERGVVSQALRHVQQRARGRDPQGPAAPVQGVAQRAQGLVQVGAPDVAPVNDANRQLLEGGQPIQHGLQLVSGAHRVDVQAGHGQLAGQAEVLLQRREVRGQHDGHAALLELAVGALKSQCPVPGQIQAEGGLVHLHPGHAACGQRMQQLGVNRDQLVQQIQALKTLDLGFA